MARSEKSTTLRSETSIRPPSLVAPSDASTVSSGDFSVGTSLASAINRIPHFDPVTGELERPAPSMYECAFYFLECYESFDNIGPWKIHCLSHFGAQGPPRKAKCPLCDFQDQSAVGLRAWDSRMDHVARHHEAGHTLESARPDFELFKHLWQKRIISPAEYRDLRQSGGSARQNEPYTITQDSALRSQR